MAEDLEDMRISSNGLSISPRGGYVLYWMQQAQRAWDNPALDHAVMLADRLGLPVAAVFGLTSSYPEANLRHYAFMLEGLEETASALADRKIPLVMKLAEPWRAALELSENAACVVCDTGYTPIQLAWARMFLEKAEVRVDRVETDVVVPVFAVSDKSEYAARTIRPKIMKIRDGFLKPHENRTPKRSGLGLDLHNEPLPFCERLLNGLPLDETAGRVSGFYRGGSGQARVILERFIEKGLPEYGMGGDPFAPHRVSRLGPYLHFGQISPVTVALAAKSAGHAPQAAIDSFLEQLVVRRELAANFTAHTPDCGDYSSVPSWAGKTLHSHLADKRPALYRLEELEASKTHDPYWNAVMTQMRVTGFAPNHLRMYWGKMVLFWSETPQQAHANLMRLNNRYFLDGRDPNSYAGVGWIFGLHDRPFKERPVYGMVRSMTAEGLLRKGDIAAYAASVKSLESP